MPGFHHHFARLGDDGLASRREFSCRSAAVSMRSSSSSSLAQILGALFPQRAGGAGADAAAGVVEKDVVVHGDVEDRSRLAVMLIGSCRVRTRPSALRA